MLGHSGKTLSDNKAVFFKINLPAFTYELVYIGINNSKFNKIDCNDSYGEIVVVGDNGKILKHLSSSNSFNEIVSYTTENIASVSVYNNRIVFGGNNKLWTASLSWDSINDSGTIQSNDVNVKDVYISGSIAYSVGGDKVGYSATHNSPSLTSNSNFSTPLNANCVIVSGSLFVGGDQGIYKFTGNSGFQAGSIELQPSSINLKINEFWAQNGSVYIYACGNNGTLVRTSNGGGSTKPFVKLNMNGNCVNSPTQFSAITGSANSRKWYVDNQLVNSTLSGFSYTFPQAGQYLITLEAKNSYNETTVVSQYINIVSIPIINKPMIVSDLILCKEESIQIQIQNSELNVKYVLRKVGETNSNYGQSPIGNGGTITLNSSVITLTGEYYLEAVNTLANCSRRFDNNFQIVVEETKADFHFGLINANTNELVKYYNNSIDAQNYQWQFTSPSGIQNSNIANPEFSYSNLGQVSVNLDVWSNNNCHDLIVKNGPYIVPNISNQNNCMLLHNNGLDFTYGTDKDDISQMNAVSDGFITCGSFNNTVFDSKYGVTLNLPNKQGAYLTKHDKNGTLKWFVYILDLYHGNSGESDITSCTEDLEGNIYITGLSDGSFYDNAGTSTNLLKPNSGHVSLKGFVIKLSSTGKLIWRIQTSSAGFIGVSIDKENNPIVKLADPYWWTVDLYFNGSYTQSLDYSDTNSDLQKRTFGLLKISPAGNLLWNTKFFSYNSNGAYSNIIGVDSFNNIYVHSSSELGADFYSTNNGVRSVLGDGTYGGKFAIAKYNSSGICLWAIRSRTTSSVYDNTDETYASGYSVDDAGNIYLSGHNECIPGTNQYTHVFENTDGSVTSTAKGQYFLAKMNTNGICEWIRSTSQRVYGS